MTRSLVALPVLVQVVSRAGERCECTTAGCHVRAGRCPRILPARLIAAPRDPAVPAHEAWRVPVEDLAAWCEGCLRRSRAAAQRDPAAAGDAAPRPALLAEVVTVGGRGVSAGGRRA